MSSIERIAVTGSSGYCGRYFISQVRKQAPHVRILGLDVAPSKTGDVDEFQKLDTRDPKIHDALEAFAPDTVVHMAFIVTATRNDAFMRDVNVNGSRNVFAAVKKLQPHRFLYYSSMTAYGAWPDNPVPIAEDWHLRPRVDFRYAADKTELEGDIHKLAQANANIAISWVRPSMILGQGVGNYISDYVLRSLMILLPDGADVCTQFVHEDDLARATWAILDKNGRGPFNVCPDDLMKWSEIAKLRGRPAMKVPSWLARWSMQVYKALRLPHSLAPGMGSPVGLVNFLQHPWVGSPKRLKEEIGFQFQYSSRETFDLARTAFQRTRSKTKSPATNLRVDSAERVASNEVTSVNESVQHKT